MLRLFEVTGFKNFKEKIQLDFSDIRDYQFNTQCITNNLISKAIIYGKNSIGKTNLGLALFDIVSHLSSNNVTPGLYDYYLNVDSGKKYAEFHYIFSFGSDIVDYLYRKNAKQQLIYEKLYLNDELLFDFDYIEKSGDMQGIRQLAPTLNWSFQGSDCILKYVINNTILEDTDPLNKLMHFVTNMLWFRSLDENRYIGYKSKSDDYFDFIFEPDVLKEFEVFLHKSGIQDNLVVRTDVDGKRRLYFNTPTPLPFLDRKSVV